MSIIETQMAAASPSAQNEPAAPVVQELRPVPRVMDAVRSLADLPRLLLLDSAAVHSERGRYSFLMADPCDTEELTAADRTRDPFTRLRGWSQQYRGATIAGLPPFQGGVAGLMSYELGGCWERIPPARHETFQLPVLSAGLYPWVLAWDHLAGRAWLMTHGWSAKPGKDPRQLAEDRSQDIVRRLNTPPSKSSMPETLKLELPLPEWAIPVTGGVWSDFSSERYLQALQRVVDYIYAGDIFQANLSQRLLLRATGSPVDLYDRLRQCNPAPFAALYSGGDWAVISASPERFLQMGGGVVSTRPIKGTRRRSTQVEADLFLRDSLRQSEKDQAENVMIVDLLRNDLSRVCRPGSICVPQLCEVETYATVQHLVSEVCGEMEPGCSPWDVFSATFPGGSITGAPKVRAMEIIAELEPTARGPYTGSLFYVGHDGVCDSNLLIRTFVQAGGWLQCGVGGGIVAQSDPQTEYEETWHKASGMLAALGIRASL